MILFGIIALIFAVGIFFLFQSIEMSRLKKYAEKFILNSEFARMESNQFDIKDGYIQDIYWFDLETKLLSSLNTNSITKDSDEVKFLKFKVFTDYIYSHQNRMRVFRNGNSAFLFAPVRIDNELKYLVFEKTIYTIESLINKK